MYYVFMTKELSICNFDFIFRLAKLTKNFLKSFLEIGSKVIFANVRSFKLIITNISSALQELLANCNAHLQFSSNSSD